MVKVPTDNKTLYVMDCTIIILIKKYLGRYLTINGVGFTNLHNFSYLK